MNYNQQIKAVRSKLQSLWNKTDEVQKEVETAQAKCKTTLPIASDKHEWFHCKDKMPKEGDYIVILNDIEDAEECGEFVAGMCTHAECKVEDGCPIAISDSFVTGHTWRYCTPQEVPNV